MEKLTFLVNWGRKKEKAWSGTNYSLYRALQRHYDIRDINVRPPFFVSVAFRILRIDWFTAGFYTDWFLKRKVRNEKGKVLQFGELRTDDSTAKTFVYQDLSVSYVKYMKRNLPDVFAVSGFQCAKEKVIEKRLVLQNEYYRKCSAIFTMGHWLKRFLCAEGIPDEKIFVVGGGYNCSVESIKPVKKTHSKVLFIGRDFKRKGGVITYQAFKMLREKGEDIELYVAGPKENPIGNPCEGYFFLGEKSRSECEELYNKCDVFCMPSYFEAYGLVFVEALIFGLPCIGRNCYEMPYFIEDGKNGFLLEEDSVNELAEKMLRLLHDETISAYVVKHREQYIQKYSWDSVATRMKSAMDLF